MNSEISFEHDDLPTWCASPNLVTAPGLEEYPGFSGTGFFARRQHRLVYITARHCLTKDHEADIGKLAERLHIPYTLSDNTTSTSDYVQWDEALSLTHESDDIPGRYIDMVALTVKPSTSAMKYQALLDRAALLPPEGRWLENFLANPQAAHAFQTGRGYPVVVTGFPKYGTDSKITYSENMPSQVLVEGVKFSGRLAPGIGLDRYKIIELSWKRDLDGFSGSPIFVPYGLGDSMRYALAGMLVTGGGGSAQFIKVSMVTRAIRTLD